jgi:hypothetical protein
LKQLYERSAPLCNVWGAKQRNCLTSLPASVLEGVKTSSNKYVFYLKNDSCYSCLMFIKIYVTGFDAPKLL